MSIIVTGAASGIGAAVVRRLSGDGYLVTGTDLTDSPDLSHHDVTNEESWRKLFEMTGPISGLVNCAGVREKTSLVETSRDDFYRVLNVNTIGTFLGIREAAKSMLKNKTKGSIVNMGSITAEMSPADQIAYNASKGAIHTMTRSAATELGPHGIRVNAVAPGSVLTPMTAHGWANEERSKYLKRRIPLGREGHPDDVASVCAFLLGDDADYVNGAVWEIDGGWSVAAP